MYFITLLFSALLAAQTAFAATTCTPAKQRKLLDSVPPGLNQIAPGASAAFVRSVPFADTCTVDLFINGGPATRVAVDGATTRDFGLTFRQFTYYIEQDKPSKSIDNNTARSELDLTAGLLHTIPLPIEFHAGLVFNYDLKTCQISSIQAYITIPTKVFGKPVTLPTPL